MFIVASASTLAACADLLFGNETVSRLSMGMAIIWTGLGILAMFVQLYQVYKNKNMEFIFDGLPWWMNVTEKFLTTMMAIILWQRYDEKSLAATMIVITLVQTFIMETGRKENG